METLSDIDEVNSYKSNPNSSDSDGDGYLDGDEIANGTNPNYIEGCCCNGFSL